MIMTPIRPTDAPARPKLDTLEDVCADLDTSETLARAAQHCLGRVREYLGLMNTPISSHLVGEMNDLETLLCEAQLKAGEAKRTVLAFHEAEFAARKSGNG